jgi:phthiodiolone/phenolphthiodiolone dimycocerosates ketoreductase
MSFQLAAFLRTTLPLDLHSLPHMDSGRYHSIWMPDHMVSFWPDSIWKPEFTELVSVSHSPHRHLDALAVAGAVGALTNQARIATAVIDSVRRHPAMLAQSALTISHLSKGRFILGLGSGEKENCVPYGFSVERAVSRLEEALKVIRLLWSSESPVEFDGTFFRLHHARLDTEPFEGHFPPIWLGASGPRMLELTGRYADGWWPAGMYSPEEIAAKLTVIRHVAEAANRDPTGIVPAYMVGCLLGEPDEIQEILRQPLVKAFALQLTGAAFKLRGYRHPMGENWGGIQEIEPNKLTRELLVQFIDSLDINAILAIVPHGTPKEVARVVKAYADAGIRLATILDYSGMAGLKFGAKSAAKVRETEDEVLRLINGGP